MGGKLRAKSQHASYVVVREFAVMTFGDSGEIRRACVERRSSGAAALAIGAVAGGAILFVHHVAGQCESRKETRRISS